MRRKKNKLLFIGLLFSGCGWTQHFHNTASLDTVSKDGFYSIPITPQLSSYLKTDLSDIRIADEKGQWVPHIVNWNLKNVTIDNVAVELTVVKKENTNTATIIIVKNNGKQNLSNFFLVAKNTAAIRKVVISGGDDQANWFTITDSVLLKAPEMIIDNKPTFNILFPVVNYNYFKITLFNGKSDPLNIEQVLYDAPGDPRKTETFIDNPLSSFTRKDTVGFSLVRIENSSSFHFNKFKISVSSPRFFDRRARLYINASGENINSFLRLTPVKEYILSSRNTNNYETSALKSKVFYLLIENRDNPPLQITNIGTEQVRKELIAYLEKEKKYKLLFDDSNAIDPDYDLQKFRDIIPDILLQLNAFNIIAVDAALDNKEVKADKKQWIWPAIITIILLLSYFTRTLIRDMKKRNNS